MWFRIVAGEGGGVLGADAWVVCRVFAFEVEVELRRLPGCGRMVPICRVVQLTDKIMKFEAAIEAILRHPGPQFLGFGV